jgi:hypothetical protein
VRSGHAGWFSRTDHSLLTTGDADHPAILARDAYLRRLVIPFIDTFAWGRAP